MSNHRKPAAFRLDDPHVIVASAEDQPARPGRGTVLVTPELDTAALPVPAEPRRTRRRSLPWASLFWSALGLCTGDGWQQDEQSQHRSFRCY